MATLLLLQQSPPVEEVCEALDGHVGHDEEGVELHAKLLAELQPVASLQLSLRRTNNFVTPQSGLPGQNHRISNLVGWQEGPQRIVDQVEDKPVRPRVGGLAVAEPVEPEEGGDGPGKDASAALQVHVAGRVAGQGGNNLG